MARKEKTPAQILGRALSEMRREAGITQTMLAFNIGYIGNSTITRIESGQRQIRLWEFIEICNFFEEDAGAVFAEFRKDAPRSKIPLEVLKERARKLEEMGKERAAEFEALRLEKASDAYRGEDS